MVPFSYSRPQITLLSQTCRRYPDGIEITQIETHTLITRNTTCGWCPYLYGRVLK